MERRYAFFANLILGLWLVISPWILGFTDVRNVLLNHIIVGALIALLALWRALNPEDEGRTWASWIMAVLGLWALISPWVFAYSTVTNRMLNDVIVGALVAVLAVWTAAGRRLVPRT